jgi:hypothetical protein
MRKLALLIAAVGAVALFASPPAHAQAKCGNDICLGSSATQVHSRGNVIVDRPILPGSSSGVIIDGGVTIVGATTAAAVTATTVAASSTISTPAGVDAGYALVNGDARVLGQLHLLSATHCGADNACGTVALSSGTPSTATKTVTSGSTCVCWPVGNTAAIAAGGCAASVSSTTATFTGPNTVTTTVAWFCFK